MKKILLLLLTVTLLFSCSSEKEEKIEDPEINEAIARINDFNVLVNTGQVLRRSSIQDREGIKSAMQIAEGAMVKLNRDSEDRSALNALEGALLNLRGLIINERDEDSVSGVFNAIDFIYVRYAREMGINAAELGTKLYIFDVASGADENDVKPFGKWSVTGSTWKRQERLDRYFLKASGSGRFSAHTWLISPTFDFRNVYNPSVRVSHLINVGENNRENNFNLRAILREAFKIVYSEDYVEGDPNLATWKRLEFPDFPTGVDFHEVDTGAIVFPSFEGKKITIAFEYNGSAAPVGNHYLTWQLLRFEIFGTGTKFSFSPFKEPIIITPDRVIDFAELGDASLEGFTQQIISGDAGDFYVAANRDGSSFVRANRGVGIRRMYSPEYDFTGMEKPAISLSHAAKGYSDEFKKLNYLKIFIAENDESLSPESLTWINLKLPSETVVDGFDPENSPWLEFPQQLVGKKVRFAFERESVANDRFFNPVWDIHKIMFIDLSKVDANE